MARKLIGVLAFGLVLALPDAASAGFGTSPSDQRYVPGEAIVRFEPGVVAAERRDARGDARVSFEQSLGLPRTQVVSFDGTVRAAIARLEDQPGVVDAQPNYRYHALAAEPNDTHFGALWGLDPTPGVDVLPAWDRTRGAGQVIAIIDTGIDLTHPDIAPNLWTGPGGIHGHDFVDNDTDPDDFNLHGTHVAGTAAAVADNGIGIAGVAPQAQLMAVRVLDGDGGGSTSDIVSGILFAAANGASVINMSLGGPAGAGDTAMSDAISQADRSNVVVVVAAGNDANNNDVNPTTPCTLGNANLICVAAVARTGARSSFSNFGRTTVDLGAPGGDGSGTSVGDIVSAKPFWAVPADGMATVFTDNFDAGLGNWTASHEPPGTVDWGIESGAGIVGDAVTDSPGANYQPDTSSTLEKTVAVNLTGKRGCRLEYGLARVGIDDPDDSAGVGVITGIGAVGQDFTGDSGGFYERIEQSISPVDGRNDVVPTFLFDSDLDINVGDGAFIDNFNLFCRGSGPYDDDIAADNALAGGGYTAIAGTSMASPHVAGVAALVRAADPGAPPSQVAQALRDGATPLSSMAGVTVTGGVADAVGAIDAALAIPNTPPPPPPPPTPTPPNRPAFGKVSVNKRGVISLVVRGDSGTTGVLTLSANITAAARVRTVGRKTFRIGSRGRTTVKVKLRRPALRQLRRKRTLRIKAKAVLKNAAGLTNSRTARIRLRLRRR
jgi:thermitase